MQRLLFIAYGLGSGWSFSSYGVALGTAFAFGWPAVLHLPLILLVGLAAGPTLAVATVRFFRRAEAAPDHPEVQNQGGADPRTAPAGPMAVAQPEPAIRECKRRRRL